MRNECPDIRQVVIGIDIAYLYGLRLKVDLVFFHRRAVKGDLLLVESILPEEQVLLHQVNWNARIQDRGSLKQLMGKYQKYFFHVPFLFRLQRSLQYFTSSQFSLHFFLQVKGLSQTGQIFTGKSDFFTFLNMISRH